MLEFEGFLLFREGCVGFDRPWCEFGGVGYLARIVFCEACAEIAGVDPT